MNKMSNIHYPDCLIWGGYDWGNVGDLLTLAIAIKRLQENKKTSVGILSSNPDMLQEQFPDIPVIPYTAVSPSLRQRVTREIYRRLRPYIWLPDPFKDIYRQQLQSWIRTAGPSIPPWIDAIQHASQLYLCGGGFLTDLFAIDFLLVPLRIALHYNVPISTAPLGIGPFTSSHVKKEVINILRRCTVTVRDSISYNFCKEHGISATPKPDDGFLVHKYILQNMPEQQNNPARQQRITIGVCIFPQYGDYRFFAMRFWWFRLLKQIHRLCPDIEIEGFCFHKKKSLDYRLMRQIFPLCGLPRTQIHPPFATLDSAIQTIQKYDIIVSTRFHAIVLARSLGIPHMAVASERYYVTKMCAAGVSEEGSSQVLVNPKKNNPSDIAAHIIALARAHAESIQQT